MKQTIEEVRQAATAAITRDAAALSMDVDTYLKRMTHYEVLVHVSIDPRKLLALCDALEKRPVVVCDCERLLREAEEDDE